MSRSLMFGDHRYEGWADIVEGLDYWARHQWVFRGQASTDWRLRTTLEREFDSVPPLAEREMFWQFVGRAPQFIASHLTPKDDDVGAWLGLIQHYGGPTRFLDVTRSPYVALFFAFERPGPQDRELWAINPGWCAQECARIMADAENQAMDPMLGRVFGATSQLVYSIVHGQPFPNSLFKTFKPFTGVFPVKVWKPDQRQSAQQAEFLCAANAQLSFINNLSSHRDEKGQTPFGRVVMPAALRLEVLDRLSTMNITAATLFPDLGGLARSLFTLPLRRPADPPEAR